MADTFKRQKLSVAPGNSVVMPLEALKDNPVYDYKLDVFSYGCLILHVFTHEWPKPSNEYIHRLVFFQRWNYTLVNEWDRRARYTTTISNDNPFYLFAKSCLENDPKKRPSMSNAITCAQSAVSSLRPLKNELEMIKENNALRKQVDQLVTRANKLEQAKENVQKHVNRLKIENKRMQENIDRLEQEKLKAQTLLID